MNTLTDSMKRSLKEAEEYGDWFSPSFHPMSPVYCSAQTAKALLKRGIFEKLCRTKYDAHGYVAGVDTLYRFKKSA